MMNPTGKGLEEKKDPSETLLIRYDRFTKAYGVLQNCLDTCGNAAEPKCLVITGPSGSGKSTLLKVFRDEHPPIEGPHGIEHQFFLDTIPSEVTLRSFAEQLLTSMKDPYPTRGSAVDLGRRIDRAFSAREGGHHVRVVALQEAQRFVDSPWTKLYNTANFLRERIENSGANFVLIGLGSTSDLIDQNEQLQRLFGATVDYSEFRWGLAQDRKEFRGILKQIRESLAALYEFPQMENIDLAFRLHYSSYGLIGYLMKIVRGATELARARHTREITVETLAESLDRNIRRRDRKGPHPLRDKAFDEDNAPPLVLPQEQAQHRRNKPRGRRAKAPRLSAKTASGI